MKLGGREYTQYPELLDKAHSLGIKSLTTEVLRLDLGSDGMPLLCVVQARLELESGQVYISHGDATIRNCRSNVMPHLIRMAETRAKARAMRDATNIGVTALEELDDAGEQVIQEQPAKAAKAEQPANAAKKPANYDDDSEPTHEVRNRYAKLLYEARALANVEKGKYLDPAKIIEPGPDWTQGRYLREGKALRELVAAANRQRIADQSKALMESMGAA